MRDIVKVMVRQNALDGLILIVASLISADSNNTLENILDNNNKLKEVVEALKEERPIMPGKKKKIKAIIEIIEHYLVCAENPEWQRDQVRGE